FCGALGLYRHTAATPFREGRCIPLPPDGVPAGVDVWVKVPVVIDTQATAFCKRYTVEIGQPSGDGFNAVAVIDQPGKPPVAQYFGTGQGNLRCTGAVPFRRQITPRTESGDGQ